MKKDATFAGVHTHTRGFNEIKSNNCYTLIKKSAVILGNQEKNQIEKIKDSFKKCA